MEGLYERVRPLAAEIMAHAGDVILVNFRFLGGAVSLLKPKAREGLSGIASDGRSIYYDPVFLIKSCKKEPSCAVHMYLHVLLHQIFFHSFRYDRLEAENWDLAVDLAVEAVILELNLPESRGEKSEQAAREVTALQKEIGALTAEKLYRYFKNNPMGSEERTRLTALFHVDSHRFWRREEEPLVTAEQWRKLSERVKADLKSFSAGKTDSESLFRNLEEAVQRRQSYTELLKRFAVMNEEIRANDDEFDYIYYTYGLTRYGNMPLVEPLEYKDSKKIREFVIVIDTSASCRGSLTAAFIRKTWEILSGEEDFFRKMNVHIIQCDHEVRQDTRITSKEDMQEFFRHAKLSGFGSTDFRPAFSYVEELLMKGEFENLKGLLYFTDGYGIYPGKMPPYEVMFVFPEGADTPPEVPGWAIRVILDEEEIEEKQAAL